jgi:hypothetical protein
MLFSYTVDYSNNPIMIVSRKKDKKKEKIHAQTAGLLLKHYVRNANRRALTLPVNTPPSHIYVKLTL